MSSYFIEPKFACVSIHTNTIPDIKRYILYSATLHINSRKSTVLSRAKKRNTEDSKQILNIKSVLQYNATQAQRG